MTSCDDVSIPKQPRNLRCVLNGLNREPAKTNVQYGEVDSRNVSAIWTIDGRSQTTVNDDYAALRQEIRDFAERYLLPSIEEEFIEERMNSGALSALGDAGYLGLCLPPRFGGRGLDYSALALLAEELARVDIGHQIVVTVHLALAGLSVLQWGTDEQRRRWLPLLATGETIATFALTEPNAGSDVGAMRATARRDGSEYVLNGEKAWISLSDVADLFIVFASIDLASKHRGICAFIVERDAPGVFTTTYHGKLGVRASNTGSVVLSDARVPCTALIGDEGEGFAIALAALGNGLFTVGAGAVGVAQAALEAVQQRLAALRDETGSSEKRQTILKLMATIARNVEVARSMIYAAAARKNRGEPNSQMTSLAKWQAAEMAFEACEAALQIFDLTGVPPFPLIERQLQNIKGSVIYGGTREIHTTMQAAYALGYRHERPFRRPTPTAETLARWSDEG